MEKLAKWYVYELADPRTNMAFYVGKGCGNRIDQHEKDALKGVCSHKANKINNLNSLGIGITKRKVALFWDEQAAYDHETDVIESYGLCNLTNVMPGGQVAFDRRLVERKDRAAKDLTPEAYSRLLVESRNILPHFVSYVVAVESGTKSANVTGNEYQVMIAKALFGGFFPKAWKAIKTSKEALKNISSTFEAHGVNLVYGSA